MVRGRCIGGCESKLAGRVMREEFILGELLFRTEFGVLGDEAVRGKLTDHTPSPPV